MSSYIDLNTSQNLSINSHNNDNPIISGYKILNEWCWDSNSKSECISLSPDNKIAYFFDNPFTISRGTAGVRGDTPLISGIHYFEVLVKEPLYGTAVMIGFGTDEVRLHYENFDYVTLIGKDSNSWGLCHKGYLWHNGTSKYYCEPFFDKDTIIGVLLNTYDRTVNYFMNGNHLGTAFRNINPENKKLYPMLSSTATDVELELLNSYRILYSLQDLCCQTICKNLKGDNYDSLPLAKRLISYLKSFS